MTTSESAVGKRVPIREGLLTGSLSKLDSVRLAGSRCASCEETSLGVLGVCPNCGGTALRQVTLNERGVLWTYTIVRHRPPGDYRGPEPFVPFGLGLVEVPEGVRVLAPILGDIDSLKIGLPLHFKPYIRNDTDGREVVAFAFEPLTEGA